MRLLPEAGLLPWPTRIVRPWLVATVGGLVFGFLLLSFEPEELSRSYVDPGPRAAVYEAPRLSVASQPVSSPETARIDTAPGDAIIPATDAVAPPEETK